MCRHPKITVEKLAIVSWWWNCSSSCRWNWRCSVWNVDQFPSIHSKLPCICMHPNAAQLFRWSATALFYRERTALWAESRSHALFPRVLKSHKNCSISSYIPTIMHDLRMANRNITCTTPCESLSNLASVSIYIPYFCFVSRVRLLRRKRGRLLE